MTDTLPANGTAPLAIAATAAPHVDDTSALAALIQGTPEAQVEAQPEAQPVEPEAPAEPAPVVQPVAKQHALAAGDFAKYEGKYIVEILGLEPPDPDNPDSVATFTGQLIAVKETGELVANKKVEGRPLSALSEIQAVSTIMRLKIGVQLRDAQELEQAAQSCRNEAAKLQEIFNKYVNAKRELNLLMAGALNTATW